jgi:drug/metabolite transporter (DMT)-like permease
MAVSALAISTSAPLVLATSADPMAIALLRLAFMAALVAGALMITRGPRAFALPRKEALWLLALGVVLGLHFGFWIPSVRSTTVTASVVLVTAHPLLVALLAHLYLREKVSTLTLAGIAVALGGVLVIFGSDFGSANIRGDLLAVGGAISLGVYLIAGRFKRREGLPVLTYTTYVYAGAALTLGAAALALGSPVASVSSQDLGLIFLMALIPGMLGHTLYNWALRFLRATVVSATHVIEPVGASLLAFWFLAQQPPPGTALGGAVTLAGIILVVYAEGRAAAARTPPPA